MNYTDARSQLAAVRLGLAILGTRSEWPDNEAEMSLVRSVAPDCATPAAARQALHDEAHYLELATYSSDSRF